MNTHYIKVKPRHPSLEILGLAVESFPRYVHRTVALHAVDVVLLSFIVRGRGYHYIDSDRYVETGASLAVTHTGQRHDIVTDARGMTVINIYLDLTRHVLPVLPAELQQLLPLLLPLHPRFVHRLNRIVRLQFDDPQPLAQHLSAIERELQTRPPGYLEAVRLHWKLFLIHCCRRALQSGFIPPTNTQTGLENLRQHLDQTFAEPHSLAALAARANLSRTTLCHTFKAYTGKSVFEYLIERRIQAALIRLRSSTDKIADIALDCGFNDLAYFNRKFKHLLHRTPGAYRRNASARACR